MEVTHAKPRRVDNIGHAGWLGGRTDTNIDCYLQIHPYYLKHREHKISEKAITEVIDKCLSGQYVPDGGRTAQ
ncbi:MAG TPA: hypothetical protein P5279_12895 [Anaerohalosphaeraceae bacterium]|nr:hypothetical protein [Anaerohalosphaeraceae bacterium]HRT51387.1 hypothetical protein [Anaerohalosphaeraceae bacterium]HRT87298.1 hypothetical protein [Anaerohalosphaeraceae bacterium]